MTRAWRERLSLIHALSSVVVVLSGLGIVATGNTYPVVAWLLVAVGALNVIVGVLGVVQARRLPRA